VQEQLHDLRASTADSSSQVQDLQARIKALEAQNRDALATYDTKATAFDRLAKELADQHQRFVDARKQLAAADEKTQALESAANHVKFRETNLQQEMELLRKNNAWYDTELQTRTIDNTKFRKEKNAQVAELQRAAADAAETIDALRRTETLLRKHMDELKTKADEDHARIQQLEDNAASTAANFRSELDSARRLTTLHQKNADMAKHRLEEVQAEYSSLQDTAANELGHMQAEVEVERTKVAEAETRIAALESMVENLEREAAQRKAPAITPGTPRRSANGAFSTPGRAGSPAAFSPGLMGNTKILTENSTLKAQLRSARDEGEQQATMIRDMMDEMQKVESSILEMRHTNETLSTQISEMSTDLDEAVAEKDAARKEARKARGDLEGAMQESVRLKLNVQDLTVQLRALIWRQQAAEQGLPSLAPEQQQFIIDSANNELPTAEEYGDTATDRIISHHLVLYKNVADIQAQNANLLRTIREVAQQHESQEARSKLAQQDQDDLVKLRSQVTEYADQIKSLTTRVHSYKRERDMYRQFATSRGTAPPEDPSLGHSINSQATMTPQRGSASQFMPQTPQPNQIPGVEKLVKDLQNQVDILKQDSATNSTSLQTQVNSLTHDNNQLQSDKLRLDSQVRREADQLKRLQGDFKLLQSEKDSLQERYYSIQATLAKQDDKVVTAQQEAVDAIARFEGLEHELNNLKASQSMWKTIEARLTERSQDLIQERDRLSKMVTDIQSLRNEQELTNAETRRRLQDKVDSLEGELHIAQRRLEDEVSDYKKRAMQHDYERTEAQRRIDDLIKAKNEVDVRCASAETARQQLEQRVNDLQSQLHAAEEQVQALRHRPAAQVNGAAEEQDESTSVEEDLNVQISELARKLKRKEDDLEAAITEMEGYKSIAQAAEEAFADSSESLDYFKAELAKVQEEKESMVAGLQRRVEEISNELETTNAELTELHGQHEQETLRLTQEKEALDADVSRLKQEVTDYKAEAEIQIEYVKSQAEIATRARQDYEHELAKHGETMKTLRTLRDEYSTVKSEISQFKTQAEAARAALEQSEEHWKTTEGKYEREVADAKRGYDDLKQHNKTLMLQFDDYKTQIDNLRSNRATTTADANAVGGNSELETIAFFRRQKEMDDVSKEVKDQQVKRLEAELGLAKDQLDQAREKLHAAQATAQSSQTGTNLQTLQNQIEQLNVFRESNSTLRNETTRLEAKLAVKSKEIEVLQNELDPLRARVTDLEGELELTTAYLKQAKDDRDHWQKRYSDFVTKSDHVDPEELEKLKQSIDTFQAERDQALEKVVGFEEQIKILEEKDANHETATKAALEAQRLDLKTTFNAKHRELMQASSATKQGIIDTLTTERDDLQATLATLKQEFETVREQLASTQTQKKQAQESLSALQQQLQQLQTQLATAQREVQTATIARDEALSRISTNTATNVHVNMGEEGQIDEGDTQASQLATLQNSLDEANGQLADLRNKAFSAENESASLRVNVSMLRDQSSQQEKELVSLPVSSLRIRN
jgi:nucleoprotein TPR